MDRCTRERERGAAEINRLDDVVKQLGEAMLDVQTAVVRASELPVSALPQFHRNVEGIVSRVKALL